MVVSLTSNHNPSVTGQTVTFTATLSAGGSGSGTPTGTVSFKDGGVAITGCSAVNLSAGSATCSDVLGTAASHTITVDYTNSDGNWVSSTGNTMTGAPQVVSADTVVVSLTSNHNPSVTGQTVTFTATLSAGGSGSGTPTGTVSFKDGGVAITGCSAVNLSAGSATCSDVLGTAASHTITVDYTNSDGNWVSSTGNTMTGAPQVVDLAPTTVSVISSGSPTAFGQLVTYTATISVTSPGSASGTPSGTITFFDNGVAISGCSGRTVIGGMTATCVTSTTPAGSQTITVQYNGDLDYAASPVSSSITQVVSQASTTISVATSGGTSVTGQAVTFTATIGVTSPGSGSPTGTVTFYDSSVAIGSCSAQVVFGGTTATCAITYTGPGTHSITVKYLGDSNFAVSPISSSITQTVNAASTAVTLVSSANPGVSGQTVTYTVTVNANAPSTGTPTGSVTFSDGGMAISGCGTTGVVALSSGVATCSITYSTLGSHTITVSYAGDGNYSASACSALSEAVNQAATSTTVGISLSSPVSGQSVTYTLTIAPGALGAGTPAGTVVLSDGGNPIASCGTMTLLNGQASCTVTYSSAGTHSIAATYSGDPNFLTSSVSTTVTVAKASTSLSLTSSASSATAGASVTFTAKVSIGSPGSGSPTGTVNFFEGTSTICSAVPPSNGTATCSVTLSTIGNNSITAVYSGDGGFSGSSASAVSVAVASASSVPGAPTDVIAVVSSNAGGANVSWTAGSSNGAAITSYTVTPMDTTTGSMGTPVTTSGTSVDITSLTAGDAYTFTVTATNAAGSSLASAVSNSILPVAVKATVTKSATSTSPTATVTTATVTAPLIKSGGSSPSAASTPVTVSASAVGEGTISVATYSNNPLAGFAITKPAATGGTTTTVTSYIDINISPTSHFKKISFTICGIAAGQQVEWYNPKAMALQPVTDPTVIDAKGCAVVTITAGSNLAPKLSDLFGTVFAVVKVTHTSVGVILTTAKGSVFVQGGAAKEGSVAASKLSGTGTAVDIATTKDGKGYWIVTTLGQVNAFGDAKFYGSLPNLHAIPNAPISAIVATPDNKGYWLIGQNGGVYHFGDAGFYGSLVSRQIHPPTSIEAMAITPDGKGYWLSDFGGQVYAFGDAGFHGSFAQPKFRTVPFRIVGIAATASGKGYWLVTATGGVYAFGDAASHGSLSTKQQTLPSVVGIAPTPDGKGYSVFGATGNVFGFGDAKSYSAPKGVVGPVIAAANG